MNIQLKSGDITKLKVDALVNAANSSLLGGGGVDGAIHRAGGPGILKECKEIRNEYGKCQTGKAVITNAGELPAKKVIHTVGPVWHGGPNNEVELLKNSYLNSLKLAEEHKIKSIAFPNISTGVYGFPKDRAAQIAVETVQNFKSKFINEVLFVCFDDENYQLYKNLIG